LPVKTPTIMGSKKLAVGKRPKRHATWNAPMAKKNSKKPAPG